jgi:hypothetical protein
MQKTIQHGGDCGTVTQQFPPVLNRTIGCDHGAGPLITIQGRPALLLLEFLVTEYAHVPAHQRGTDGAVAAQK